MENRDKDTFQYTYSAKNQEEIRRIREKYSPQTEDKMDRLRRLDENVTRKGSVAALVLGIIGTLLMGLGMSCAMVWMGRWFIPGIVIGIAGIAMIAAAYPAYTRITARERERIAPEIIRLTDELMK